MFQTHSNTVFISRGPSQAKISLLKTFRILYCNEGDDLMLLQAYMKVFYPVCPFNFNGIEFLPPAKKQYWSWVPLFIFMAFQLTRYILTIRDLTHKAQLDDTFVMVFWCWTYISTTIHLFNGVYNSNHFLKTLNSWISYKGDQVTPFSFLLRKLMPLGTMSTLINLSFMMIKPNASHFLYSSTNLDPASPYFWTYLPFFLFYESLSSYIVFGCHMIHDALLMGWVTAISANILELSSTSEAEGKSITNQEMLKYRTLQVFEKMTNQAFSRVFLFIKFSSYFKISYIAVMVISGFATLNVINIVYGIPLGLPLILRIHGYLPGMAVMRRQSIDLLEKWRNQKVENMNTNRKFISSCRILVYNAGGAYEIKESTILSFSEGVTSQTVALLIALKEQQLF